MDYSKLAEKNILVTGGCGFIGSNLCDFLVDIGSNVTCLDNLSTGYLENIEHLNKLKNFQFINADIRDLEVCLSACKGKDFVLHNAALGSVPRSMKDPITTNEVNISGFLNMLIASRDNNISRFIYAASSSTYGDSQLLPKKEEKIGAPLSPYAITKYVNELYASNFKLTYGLNTIGLRYFNVFGKRQDPDGAYAAVIPKFIKSLISLKSPVINGDGSYSRDFTYIKNVIEMNMLALTVENKEALNQIYNTAYGERTNLNELFNLIKKHLIKFDKDISKINPIYGEVRQGDIPHSLASIEKAKSFLNYNPKFSLEKGLEDSLEWYFDKFRNE